MAFRRAFRRAGAAAVRVSRVPIPRSRRARAVSSSQRSDVQIDARHANFPDEQRRPLRHVQPDPERGLEPGAPLRALRRAGAVRRHADAREGPVPRRLVRRVASDDGRVRRTLTHRIRHCATSRARKQRYWPDGRVNVVYPERRRQARHPRRHADVRPVGVAVLDDDRRPRGARHAVSRRARTISRLRRQRDRPADRVGHQVAGRRRGLPIRRGRLAAMDALRVRHEHDRAHDDQRARGRGLPRRRA